MKAPPLRNWNLGNMRSVPPEKLFGKEEARDIDALMLMLSLAFNDLKIVAWILDLAMDAQKHYEDDLSPELGQVGGMAVFAQRQMVGILHETLDLIRKNRPILESREFKSIKDKMPVGPRGSWDQIASVAQWKPGLSRKGIPTDLRGWLHKVRNHAVFHYGQPKLLTDGYRRFFFECEAGPHNAAAYFSEGPNMEATRFFYADAAAQGALQFFNENAGLDILKNGQAFNSALKHLITAYLEDRAES